MPTSTGLSRPSASAPRPRLAAVFPGVRANLLVEVTEEANTHVEDGTDEFVTYVDTADDPLTGRALESGPRLVGSHLSQRVPGSDDALAAAVDGRIVQMDAPLDTIHGVDPPVPGRA